MYFLLSSSYPNVVYLFVETDIYRIHGRQPFCWGWRKSWRPKSWRRTILPKFDIYTYINVLWFYIFLWIDCTVYCVCQSIYTWLQLSALLWLILVWFLIEMGMIATLWTLSRVCSWNSIFLLLLVIVLLFYEQILKGIRIKLNLTKSRTSIYSCQLSIFETLFKSWLSQCLTQPGYLAQSEESWLELSVSMGHANAQCANKSHIST